MGINDLTAPAGTPLYFVPENVAMATDIETGMVASLEGGCAWTKDMVFAKHDTLGLGFVPRDRTFLTRGAAEAVFSVLRRTKMAA